MYVVPFCMGPLSSSYSKLGVQITDSPYVVLHLRLLTRMGANALKMMKGNSWFLPLLHSVGCPLKQGEKDKPWPCNPENQMVKNSFKN
jgi:phosphoenolpyruvate carboxykinase (GTP)